MPVPRWNFQPRPLMTLIAIATVALAIALAQWQGRRAAEKIALAAELDSRGRDEPVLLRSEVDAAALEYRRVVVRGQYEGAKTVLLDNKVHKGAAGYQVLTPLRIEGGQRNVLVNRGWIAAGPRRDQLPAIPAPAGPQTINGIASVPTRRFLELGPDAATGPVRQNVVIERLERELGLPLLPIVILQTDETGDGLARAWERPDTGVEKHRVYSLQWYALAALAAILYVVLNIQRSEAR